MARLLGCVEGGEELVDAADKSRQVALVALAHMLADAWRVLTLLPRFNAETTRAMLEALVGGGK